MGASTTTSSGGMFVAYTGTLQEVINALDTNGYSGRSFQKAKIYYNGSDITAVVEVGTTA